MEDVLIQEIERLREKLGAKRYKLADKVVDTSYKLMRKVKPVRSAQTLQQTVSCNKKRAFNKGHVDIVNHQFYDWDGDVLYKGGAERYVTDLAKLLKKLGYKVRILQGANEGFHKIHQGIDVVGIKMEGRDRRTVSKAFDEYCRNDEFVIASPDEIAICLCNVPCIAINHGVNFDGPWRHEEASLPAVLENPYWSILGGLRGAKMCACVDTNFINWVRTRDADLSKKLVFIPNYFDEKVFKPLKPIKNKKIVFVFPRRVEEARGSVILKEAFTEVMKTHPDIELRIAGQIQNSDSEKDVEYLLKTFSKNVTHCQYDMENVYKAYQGADVVLVPTCWSEGTSLSCLEGQASGLPVIATNVGGLPNLVIDRYNGLLIAPTAKALCDAMIEMIENQEAREEMAKHAIEVSKCFKKENWERRWEKIIREFSMEVNKDE